ncbi:MAG TPA: L,D-transpeptidase [Xanthobacteraceae bacterium]|nr:L,D-transpeptidase [Xanthobacteraceae bacterium]
MTEYVHGLPVPDRGGGKRHRIAVRAGRAALMLALAAVLAGRAEAAPGLQKKHRHGEPAKRAAAEKPPSGPLLIVVSIASQHVSLYADGAFVARGPVSTGMHGHPTPVGVFTVIQKDRYHRSNIYSAAPMPYMQRITWSGVAIHQGVLPGYPASHGCIRTSTDFAIRLWGTTKLGARVIVARHDVAPGPIANPHLFVPRSEPAPELKPEPAVVRTLAPPAIVVPAVERVTSDPADFNNPIELKGSDDAGAPAAAPAGPAPIDDAKAAADAAMLAEAPRKPGMVSVFVSRKTGRLYVRYNNQPLFDVPVEIRDPDRPIGTHVFTALDLDKDANNMRWSVVTIPADAAAPRAEVRRGGRKSRLERETEVVELRPSVSAGEALNRVEMPKEAIERVSEMLAPGASLIISDQAMSGETGRDTDFIILTH